MCYKNPILTCRILLLVLKLTYWWFPFDFFLLHITRVHGAHLITTYAINLFLLAVEHSTCFFVFVFFSRLHWLQLKRTVYQEKMISFKYPVFIVSFIIFPPNFVLHFVVLHFVVLQWQSIIFFLLGFLFCNSEITFDFHDTPSTSMWFPWFSFFCLLSHGLYVCMRV